MFDTQFPHLVHVANWSLEQEVQSIMAITWMLHKLHLGCCGFGAMVKLCDKIKQIDELIVTVPTWCQE
jgi:hypothetical protein